jgi:hypothetical protein
VKCNKKSHHNILRQTEGLEVRRIMPPRRPRVVCHPRPTMVGFSCPGCRKIFNSERKLKIHKSKSRNGACFTARTLRDVWAPEDPSGAGKLQTQTRAPGDFEWIAVPSGFFIKITNAFLLHLSFFHTTFLMHSYCIRCSRMHSRMP